MQYTRTLQSLRSQRLLPKHCIVVSRADQYPWVSAPTSFLPLPSANGLCLWLFRSRNQGPTHARVLTPERQL